MRANKNRDTKPELTVRKAIWAAGYRGYRTSWRKAPGRPDIAFVGKKVAIIIHGCFWHNCKKCMRRLPKANRKYWSWKFESNRERDRRNLRRLKKEGWRTLVVWEHEIKNLNLSKIHSWLKTNLETSKIESSFSESNVSSVELTSLFFAKMELMAKKVVTKIVLGDSKAKLAELADNSVDLIVTSPPYADQRKSTYGGISPDKYVEWFLPISEELLRVLKPTGTFILNIKEKVVDGERHTYVIELITALRKQGWVWTEEFIWHKKNSFPGKWPNRFRDGWERLLQFNKTRHFNMYQDAVMVPMGDWAKARLKNLSETDKRRDNSKVGSGFGKNISNWLGRELAYPDNVLHLATETSNKNHSAVFPEALPEWFIKLFTKEGDWVLDPFLGSGTTCAVAKRLNRNSVGIELLKSYYNMAKREIEGRPLQLVLRDKNKRNE